VTDTDHAPCPACGATLTKADARYTVLTCSTCGGVWTDKEATERVANVVDRELIEIAQGAAKSCDGEPANIAPTDERACPICRKALIPIRHVRVAIEVCREHGTWFDRDELGRMARNSDYERRSQAPEPPSPQPTDRPAGIRPPTGSSADLIGNMLDDDR
jgi:Zn-finger nucleic acid-binding protein